MRVRTDEYTDTVTDANQFYYSASAWLAMPTAILARPFSSVRPFVRHVPVFVLSRGMKIRSCGFQHLVGQSF